MAMRSGSVKTMDYLSFIVNEIHTTVVATVDEEGLPATCAIDMMDSDADSLYFLTATGKSFYRRLIRRNAIALTGMKGENTLSCVAVSVRGKVRDIGPDKLPELFRKNAYMESIYPDEHSRSALTVFQLYEGIGEWFDLPQKPIERVAFSFGGARAPDEGYHISDRCIHCGACAPVCPQKCIDMKKTPAVIQQAHCLRCGNCHAICPVGAVERR